MTLLQSELGVTEVAPEVRWHFRDIHNIQILAEATGIEIEVFDRPFEPAERADYTNEVIAKINALPAEPTLVFPDPDTGLLDKPYSTKHALPGELKAIWQSLRPADWLIFYQHASRQVDWASKRRREFQAACPDAHVLQFSPNGARDVLFFAASRSARCDD